MSYADFLNNESKAAVREQTQADFGVLTNPEKNPWMDAFTAEGGVVCEIVAHGCLKPKGTVNAAPLKIVRFKPLGVEAVPGGPNIGVTHFIRVGKDGSEDGSEKGQIISALDLVDRAALRTMAQDDAEIELTKAEKKLWPSIPANTAYSEGKVAVGKTIRVQIVTREAKDGKTYYNPTFSAA